MSHLPALLQAGWNMYFVVPGTLLAGGAINTPTCGYMRGGYTECSPITSLINISIHFLMDEQQSGAPAPQPAAPAPQKSVLMGVLSYLGPLVIVSYATTKDDPFVKFHIRQGFVLLAIEVVAWLAGTMMWQLWSLISIVNIGTLVLSIIGIVNVVQGQQKELPLVGGFATHVRI